MLANDTQIGKKEFVKSKQGNKFVAEYERDFMQLSKYAREIVFSEEEMLVRMMELREFVLLSNQAQKMEEICNNKKQNKRKA